MSIYEKTPAYCERVAHIAEKAMPICKGMAKLYLMFHEKTTTVFERRKNMKKILSFVLVFAMIMAVTSTAFAATGNFTDKEIFGGSSQDVFTGARSRTNNVIVKVTKTVGLNPVLGSGVMIIALVAPVPACQTPILFLVTGLQVTHHFLTMLGLK